MEKVFKDAHKLGLSIEEVVLVIERLKLAGLNASATVTTLRKALDKIQKDKTNANDKQQHTRNC